MRIQNVSSLLIFALLLSGCASLPTKTASGYLDELARHVERNKGLLVASNGPVLALRRDGEGAVLRVATQNYGHLFDVSFSQYPAGLTIGQDVSFLGTLEGSEASMEAYGGNILVVKGIALKAIGGVTLQATDQPELSARWLDGTLDLSPGANPPVTSPVPTVHQDLVQNSGTPEPPPSHASAAPAVKASSAVTKMLAGWRKLSDADRADFLRRAGISP